MAVSLFSGKFFEPFKVIKKYLQVNHNKVVTDNWIFKLQTKFSFVLVWLALFFLMTPAIVLRDLPIDCFGPSPETIRYEFLDAYCFLHGTYIVPEAVNLRVGIDIPFRGISPDGPSTTKVYQLQYIFFPLILTFQIILIRVSRAIWKVLEGGRLDKLLSELTTAIVDEEKMKKRINIVTDYMTSKTTFHTSYAYRYVFSELFTLTNFVFQFCIVNSFLNNEYLGFGWNGVRYISSLSNPKPSPSDYDDFNEIEIVEDPFIRLFPKMTMCRIDVASAGGNLVMHEALCVMTLNNIAEKVFFVLWFWFMIMGIVTMIGLIYRCAVLFSKRARYIELSLKVNESVCTREELKYLVDNSSYGDWFVFTLIQKNTDVYVFSNLLNELLLEMSGTRRKNL